MIFLPFYVFFTVTSFCRCTVTAQKSCTFPLFSWCDFRCIFLMWFFNVFPQVVDVILRLSLSFSLSYRFCMFEIRFLLYFAICLRSLKFFISLIIHDIFAWFTISLMRLNFIHDFSEVKFQISVIRDYNCSFVTEIVTTMFQPRLFSRELRKSETICHLRIQFVVCEKFCDIFPSN